MLIHVFREHLIDFSSAESIHLVHSSWYTRLEDLQSARVAVSEGGDGIGLVGIKPHHVEITIIL